MQASDIDTERGDRRRPDGPGDPVQLRSDRVQRPRDPVVVEQARPGAERLVHRVAAAHAGTRTSSDSAVSRFATSSPTASRANSVCASAL